LTKLKIFKSGIKNKDMGRLRDEMKSERNKSMMLDRERNKIRKEWRKKKGNEQEKDLRGGCLMLKVANVGFLGLAHLVSIFTVEVIRIIFYFRGFPNETGGIMWIGG